MTNPNGNPSAYVSLKTRRAQIFLALVFASPLLFTYLLLATLWDGNVLWAVYLAGLGLTARHLL